MLLKRSDLRNVFNAAITIEDNTVDFLRNSHDGARIP